MNEDDQLNSILENAESERTSQRPQSNDEVPNCASPPPLSLKESTDYRQWQIGPNDTFRPAGLTCEALPCGVYEFDRDGYGNLYIKKVEVITDSLITLPDNASERVLSGMTNYPDRLGARIVNRPSRFDERILVGMPSAAARKVYLRKVASELTDEEIERWVADTDQLSVAHLRELSAAVLCLGQDYPSVLSRLKIMKYKPKEKDGIESSPLGFK